MMFFFPLNFFSETFDIIGAQNQRFGFWRDFIDIIFLKSVTFYSITSSYELGGAIYFDFHKNTSLLIKNSIFYECTSISRAGCIYFKTFNGSCQLYKCCFHRCD